MSNNVLERSRAKTKAGLQAAIDRLTNGDLPVNLIEDALLYINNGTLANGADIHLGQRASDALPLQNGIASKGGGNALAMSNHIHPKDSSKVDIASITDPAISLLVKSELGNVDSAAKLLIAINKIEDKINEIAIRLQDHNLLRTT